eukprot:TRINITY_DN21685_c0_g1_i1.p2 TRINITY_DN21685_c0_g1~~TRINITY_DN21685_c0_g1_i1.p2  ORF type:complete len:173 (+),score=17.52 TRINITY_DN21685_c0_g1_i1:425-943(+)
MALQLYVRAGGETLEVSEEGRRCEVRRSSAVRCADAYAFIQPSIPLGGHGRVALKVLDQTGYWLVAVTDVAYAKTVAHPRWYAFVTATPLTATTAGEFSSAAVFWQGCVVGLEATFTSEQELLLRFWKDADRRAIDPALVPVGAASELCFVWATNGVGSAALVVDDARWIDG